MNKSPQNVDDLFTAEGVRPVAEIEVGPTKHEKFLDQNYKKIALAVIGIGLVCSGFIVWNGIARDKELTAGNLLVQTLDPNGQINEDKLHQITSSYAGTDSAVTAAYLEAVALWNQGKDKEGCAKMEAFIQSVPSPEWVNQASVILGSHYMKSGQLADAERLFKSIVDLQQKGLYSPLAYLSLGDIARSKGDYATAKRYYDDLATLFPESNFVISQLGLPARRELLEVKAPEKVAPPATAKKDAGTKTAAETAKQPVSSDSATGKSEQPSESSQPTQPAAPQQ